MTEKRHALIVATYQYDDTDLRQLVSPAHDAEALSRVLKDPVIGGFDVKVLLNKPSYEVKLAIDTFFNERGRDELLMLYFTGHGIKDEDGKLYFSTRDTKRKLVRATAVEANFVNDVMQRSRSRRQVLLLDCCYSGAFARGMVGKSDRAIGTGERFEGSGRVVLTASDAMQYSFEGKQVEGKGVPSVFTSSLVHGLKSGEADLDSDGKISLDELYDYVHDRVIDKTPEQRPGKWNFGVQGQIVIARNPNPIIKPVELPNELTDAMENPLPGIRKGAVDELESLLNGINKGLVLSALEALKRMKDDDSTKVKVEVDRILEKYKNGQSETENKTVVPETVKAEHKRIVKEKFGSYRNTEQKEKKSKTLKDVKKAQSDGDGQQEKEVSKFVPERTTVKRGSASIQTASKKKRLIWLLPSILVPFIGGMSYLGVYISRVEKTVPILTAIETEPEEIVKEPVVHSAKVTEKRTTTITKFRSTEKKLSYIDVKNMLEHYKFYCKKYDWSKEYSNPGGSGFKNKFEEQIVNGDKVIMDHASGLMWEQYGAKDYMTFENAKTYISNRNSDQFAGHNDWRLPTLEEAMSLMEPEQNSDNLYIDSIFDPKQKWIWTSDMKSASRAWVVYFGNGSCSSYDVGNSNDYVRAVR